MDVEHPHHPVRLRPGSGILRGVRPEERQGHGGLDDGWLGGRSGSWLGGYGSCLWLVHGYGSWLVNGSGEFG